MLDAYRGLIDELLAAPAEIRGMIDAAAPTRASPELKRLLAELRDRDKAMYSRVQIITRQENPYLTDMQLIEVDADLELDALVEEFESARGDLVSQLINLSLRDWERVAMHDTEGEVTLVDEVEKHVDFDESQRQRLRQFTSSR